MKILLIQPPIRDFYQTRHRMYPLGLLYLAAALKKAGFSCRILDAFGGEKKKSLAIPEPLAYLSGYYATEDKSPFKLFGRYYHFGLEDEPIREQMKEADLVGISALFTPYEDEVLRLAAMAKDLGKVVVVGGNHATVCAEHLLLSSVIDYVISGEGEEGLVALVEALGGRKTLESIDGLGYRHKEQIRLTPAKGVLSCLDALSFPERSLLEGEHYQFQGRRFTMMLSSRGCPYHCRFCSGHAVMGQGIRYRSIENILAEMHFCWHTLGIRVFDFEDENFTLDKARALDLLTALEAEFEGKEDFTLLFENGLCAHTLDQEILSKLKKLNCHHLNLPLVSSSVVVLKDLKRPGHPEAFDQIVRQASGRFFITGYLIIGLPSADLEEMIESIRFLSARQVLIAPSIFYVTPGTELYSECREQGLLPFSSLLSLRSSAMPVETERFQRLDLVTLFRLVRLVNFLKSLLDEAKNEGELSLLEFLRSQKNSLLPEIIFCGPLEISTPRPLSQREIGLLMLTSPSFPSSPFYQVSKEKSGDRLMYRFIPREYSDKVWRSFTRRMNSTPLAGITNHHLSLRWDL